MKKLSITDPWRTERVFLTVKAYPTISKRHHEASCMAGITRGGEWIRLYPVQFRDLEDERKFAKYTWIEARVRKSTDFRIESHYVDMDSIQPLEVVSTDNDWSQRNAIVLPMLTPAAQVFRDVRPQGQESLALIKPAQIIGLEIDKTPDEDFRRQVHNLNMLQNQMSMLQSPELKPLELVPYSFRYEFIDDNGTHHTLKIVDWEIYQLFRKCQYRANWEDLIRQKYIGELTQRNLHLFLGTMHLYPNRWIIIGVYYPSGSASQANMFDAYL